MALDPGTSDATSGLAKAIYTAIDAELRPPLEKKGLSLDQIAQIQAGWKPFSHTIAVGIIAGLRKEPLPTPPPVDPVFAETYSSATQDGFWQWLSMFVAIFKDNPAPALQGKVAAFILDHPIPTDLKGILR